MVQPVLPDSYRAYDPAHEGDAGDASLARVLIELHRRDRSAPLTLWGFKPLTMALQLDYQRVSYESHRLESGHMYWVNEAHARALGEALPARMQFFGLVLSCFDAGAVEALVSSTNPSTQIDEVLVKHATGDEVTTEEARGLARWAARVHCRTFRLWAHEFEPGSLEAFQDALLEADPRSLCELDVCLTALPEPDDRRALPRVHALLARNAAGG